MNASHKTFEEFIQTRKYKQIKELPERGKIAVDADECESLQLALYKNNYRWPSGASVIPLAFEKHKEDNRQKLEIGWFTVGVAALIHQDKHKKISSDPNTIKDLKLLEFDEYFEPTDKYLGHHAGKKYGI